MRRRPWLAENPLGRADDFDKKGLAFGDDSAIIELGARFNLKPSGRLSDDLGPKGHPRA
jgi:hypothetical protein